MERSPLDLWIAMIYIEIDLSKRKGFRVDINARSLLHTSSTPLKILVNLVLDIK